MIVFLIYFLEMQDPIFEKLPQQLNLMISTICL